MRRSVLPVLRVARATGGRESHLRCRCRHQSGVGRMPRCINMVTYRILATPCTVPATACSSFLATPSFSLPLHPHTHTQSTPPLTPAAGACAVVPEILEPSLQLAAAVLGTLKIKPDEVSNIIDDFRRSHMAELSLLTSLSGGSLGYGLSDGGKDDGAAMALDISADEVEDVDDIDIIPAKPAAA